MNLLISHPRHEKLAKTPCRKKIKKNFFSRPVYAHFPPYIAIMPVTASSSSSRTPAKPVDPFHRLVQDLSNVLGPSSGLTSADVDPKKLMELMQKYTSNESEWKPYALGDPTRTFTRNLVDRGNGKSNLVRERMRSPKRLPTFGNPAADGPNTVNFGLDSW